MPAAKVVKPVRVLARPAIDEPGAVGYLLWLRRDQPKVYAQVLARVPELKAFEAAAQQADAAAKKQPGMHGLFSSLFSKIAGVAKIALPKVASVVKAVAPTALQVGSDIMQAKQQAALMQAQLQLAQAQAYPMQTATAYYPGQPQPQIVGMQSAAGYTSPLSIFDSIPWWVFAGGAGLIALLILRR